jgi:mannose-6-phosphate isomerase
MAQARSGFAAEEAARVPHDAPNRNYKDASHKPELISALGRFDAFSGFRRTRDTLLLLRELGAEPLLSYGAVLERTPGPQGLRSLYGVLSSLAETEREKVVWSTLEACAAHRDRGGEFARECAWILRLGELYPGDMGIVLALLLNLVELEPGQAIYLSAGNLHVYLRGVGIEIMANSDNVLRGGLTPKHVDPSELTRVLTFADEPVPALVPRGPSIEQTYATPVPEFRLSRIALDEGARFRSGLREGPEILLCVSGRIVAHAAQGDVHELARGAAVFVSAGDGDYELDGRGTLFRAAVGGITR